MSAIGNRFKPEDIIKIINELRNLFYKNPNFWVI